LRAIVEACESRTLLSTFVVNTTSDVTNASDGLTTLREAVVSANAHAGADTISFSSSVFTAGSLHTIKLTGGQLTITDTKGATTITGPGAGVLSVNGNAKDRVFQIASGATVTLSGLLVTNGLSVSPSPGAIAKGGGILNAGTLTLNNITVSANTAKGGSGTSSKPGSGAWGGGIYSTGPLTLNNCSITSNTAQGGNASSGTYPNAYGGVGMGGGIAQTSSGLASTSQLVLNASIISGNTAIGGNSGPVGPTSYGPAGSAGGGGVSSSGKVTATGCNILNNSAKAGNGVNRGVGGGAAGGGLDCSSLTMSNTTVGGNTATGGRNGGRAGGGGISVNGPVQTISSSVVSGNRAVGGNADTYPSHPGNASGGGINSLGSLSVSLSTISGNTAQGGVGGGSASGGGIFGSYSQYYGETVSIDRSTISGNVAQGGANGGLAGAESHGGHAYGGGICTPYPAMSSITNSTFAGNSANGGTGSTETAPTYLAMLGGSAYGGAVNGGFTLTNCTITGNTAHGGQGGASTRHQNGADGGQALGGAIETDSGQSNGSLLACTIVANNVVGGAGGAAGDASHHAGHQGSANGGGVGDTSSVELDDCIVSANTANKTVANDIAGDLSGGFLISSYNLVGVGGGLTNGVDGNKVGITNPKLGALANNGGQTQTMLPLVGSPVIDAGGFVQTSTDQRGLPRVVGAHVDMGAVEWVKPASISGVIFNDLNGNGVLDTGEKPIAGSGCFIDFNNNGVLDVGDYSAVADATGKYTFANLGPGTYHIHHAPASGWRGTVPSGDTSTVTVTAGQNVTGKNFGDTQRVLISGTVFNDANGNKTKDSSETGLSGWRVYFDVNNDGKWESTEPSTLTDSTGSWKFVSLAANTFVIRLTPPTGQTGWTQTTAQPPAFTLGSAGIKTGLLFGERKLS
jgi:hypothetical protein